MLEISSPIMQSPHLLEAILHSLHLAQMSAHGSFFKDFLNCCCFVDEEIHFRGFSDRSH